MTERVDTVLKHLTTILEVRASNLSQEMATPILIFLDLFRPSMTEYPNMSCFHFHFSVSIVFNPVLENDGTLIGVPFS
jgi:hypothetical protein